MSKGRVVLKVNNYALLSERRRLSAICPLIQPFEIQIEPLVLSFAYVSVMINNIMHEYGFYLFSNIQYAMRNTTMQQNGINFKKTVLS